MELYKIKRIFCSWFWIKKIMIEINSNQNKKTNKHQHCNKISTLIIKKTLVHRTSWWKMTKIDTRGGRIKIEGGVVEKPWKKYTVGDVYCTFIKILLYRRYSFSLKLCFLFSAYLHIMWIKEYNTKKKSAPSSMSQKYRMAY